MLSARQRMRFSLLRLANISDHPGRAEGRDDGSGGASSSGAAADHAGAGHRGGDVDRRDTAAQGRRSSYASVTGEASSYARVHGEVSRAPADWRDISSVARETLDDVRYQKAEGIAKARTARAVHTTFL